MIISVLIMAFFVFGFILTTVLISSFTQSILVGVISIIVVGTIFSLLGEHINNYRDYNE